MMEDIFEYELINIAIETGYDLPVEEHTVVREDGPKVTKEKDEEPAIKYDADGIPMGSSMQEIREREVLINDFLEKWGKDNPERRVFNQKLEDYIHIKGISVIEAKEHSAKSYKSTRALMILDEILRNASPIKRVPKKSADRNQKNFSYFIVMIYKHQDIGTIKLTVGVKKNQNKIQYGISALKPGEPLIDYSEFKQSKNKRSPRK